MPQQNWGKENVGDGLSQSGGKAADSMTAEYLFTFQLQQLVSPQSTNKNLKEEHLKAEPPEFQRVQLASHYY